MEGRASAGCFAAVRLEKVNDKTYQQKDNVERHEERK